RFRVHVFVENPTSPLEAVNLPADIWRPTCVACRIHQGGPIFKRHRLDSHHWPITFDGMYSAAGSENAPELAYRSFRITHIDDRVSCGQPIQRLVRQGQNGTITLMGSDPIANSRCVRIFP